jgi:putative membrane protein
MYDALCHSGNLGVVGGWIELILNLVLGVGLIAGLTLLVVLAIRRGRVPSSTASGQPTAKENLQARYARGEITREQYEQKKQDIG